MKFIHYLTRPESIAFAKKVVSAWILAFFAASGGIWARRWHKDHEPRPPSRPQPPRRY